MARGEHVIQNPSGWGQFGQGFGQGLSEQIPKEIDRYRLASGLREFEQNAAGLSPTQQVARAGAIPGISPAVMSALIEASKLENRQKAYQNLSGGTQNIPASANIRPAQEQQLLDQATGMLKKQPQQPSPELQNQPQRATEIPSRNEPSPAIRNKNPVTEEFLPRGPWTPQERNDRTGFYLSKGFTLDEARGIAADDEARELAQPGAVRERDEYLKGVSNEVSNEFRKQLSERLQKSGEGVYQDITGDNILEMERGIERDLINNPNENVKNVVDRWSKKGLSFADAKGKLNALSLTTGLENFLPGRSEKTLEKLKTYSKIYKDAGQSKEFYETLKNKFNMSPGGSASLSYEPEGQTKKYISNYKPTIDLKKSLDINQFRNQSRKAAIDLENMLDENVSIQAFARALKQKNPMFDEANFFKQLREDIGNAGFNDRQKIEIAEGASSILPTWGDVLYLH